MSFESEQAAVVQSLLAVVQPESSKYVAVPSGWWKAWLRRTRSFSFDKLSGPGVKKLAPKPGPIPAAAASEGPAHEAEPAYIVPYAVYCALVDWHGTTSKHTPFAEGVPPTPHNILFADNEGDDNGSNGNNETLREKPCAGVSSSADKIVETKVETKKVVSKAKPKKKKKKKKKKGGKKKKSNGEALESSNSSATPSCAGDVSETVKASQDENGSGSDEEDSSDDDDGREKIELVCQVSMASFKEEEQFTVRVPRNATLLELRKKIYPVLAKQRRELEGNFESAVVMGKRFWDPPVMWENLEDEDYDVRVPLSGPGRSAGSTLEEVGVDDTFRITLAVVSEKRRSELKAKHDEEVQQKLREDEEFERRCALGALFMPAAPYTAPSHVSCCCYGFNERLSGCNKDNESKCKQESEGSK